MQFGRLAVAAAASGAVHAASTGGLELTDSTFAGITAGVPVDLTWTGADGAVTLVLLDDSNPNDVKPIATIASGETGTSFVWTPAETLINAADYAIQINDAVTTNYGEQFQLVGGATATPSDSSSSSTPTASTTPAGTTPATTPSASSSTTPAPSTTVVPTTFSNHTTTKSHSQTSSSSASATSSGSGSQTTAPSAANNLASPLALIFLTVAALFSLN